MSWQKYLPGNGYWTGRSNLYKDDKKVDYVINELSGISSNTVENGRKNVQSAIHDLNQTLVNTGQALPDGALDSYFDAINEVIVGGGESAGMIDLINQKKESADDYAKQTEEHPFLTILGTGGMVLSKFGEGFVSAFEAVGDGAITLTAGTVTMGIDALAGTHTNDHVASFVEKDLSGTAFGALNDVTGISKYSFITSDSGLSNLCKGAGVATGYLAMGGLVSGYAAGASKATTFTKFLTSSTNANTVIAGIGGMGSGTQNSLRSGNTFATAYKDGLIQGVEQAGTAYAMGKLGEHIEKGRQTKLAESKAKFYENEYKNASAELEKATNPENGMIDQIDQVKNKYETAKTNKVNAQTELENIKSTKIGIKGSTEFQGYNDPVSRSFREKGESLATNGIKNTASESWKQFKSNVKEATHKTIQPDGADAVEKTKFSLRKTVKNGLKTGKDIVVTPIKTVAAEAKYGVSTLGINGVATAETVARDIIGAGAAYRSAAADTKANQVFQARVELGDSTDKIKNVKVEKDTPTDSTQNSNQDQDSTSMPSPNPSPSPTSNTSTTQNPTPDPGTSTTQNPTPDPGTSTTQFKKKDPNPTPDANKDNSNTPSKTSDSTDSSTTKEPTSTTKEPTSTTKEPTSTSATPPSTNPGTTTTTTGGGTFHTGGGYTGTGGYTENNTTLPTDGTTDTTSGLDDIKDTLTDGTTSIEDVIKGSKYTKIPSTPSPVTTSSSSSGSSAVIPIAAGLSAAAAAGIGAKAYMDRKKNNDNGEDEDEFDTDEWSGDDSVDIQYDDSSDNENYLDADDDYSYQTADSSEKYDARSSDELADLQ